MKAAKDYRILVVDDEIHIREIVAFDLGRQGYQTAQAACGTEALAMIKATPFDLVVSDVRMPSGNGTQLLAWVKELNPLTPSFLFMTAFADISADEALALGAEAFLVKPFRKADLLEEVEVKLAARDDRWQTMPADVAAARRIVVQEEEWDGGQLPHVALGSGGLFLEMASGFPTSLETIAFDVPVSTPALRRLAGYARVRWVRHEKATSGPPGIGLEFVYLEPESRQRYLDFLATTPPRGYVPLGSDEAADALHLLASQARRA